MRICDDLGFFVVDDWRELMICVFKVLAHAIHLDVHGKCSCGCTGINCNYCSYECF